MHLILSLFPGIGLLDMAFESEGFCVVRGPDVLWGGDIRNFHPPAGRFDGVIAGPPCQEFSSLSRLVRATGRKPKFGNLIPEFERCVSEAKPTWFLMENVPQAPTPKIPQYSTTSFLLDNSWLPLTDNPIFGNEQMRLRRFTFGMFNNNAPNLRRWIEIAPFLLPDRQNTQTQWTPTNSKKAKTRTRTLTPLEPNHIDYLRVSTNRHRHETLTGGNDRPPGIRRRTQPVTAMQGSESKRPESNGVYARRYSLEECCRLQGLPIDFLKDSPFTADGKRKAIANGVPLAMGRAIARAVKEAIQ